MKKDLIELDAYHKASGHVHRWYLCVGSRGWKSRTDDIPAAVTWLPLVAEMQSVTAMAGGAGEQRGQRDALRLINVRQSDDLPHWASVLDLTDGTMRRVPLGLRPLNVLLTDYVVQRIVQKELEEEYPYSTAVTVWRGKAGMTIPDRSDLSVPAYDRMLDFDASVLEEKYLGTGGLEGPEELKDVTKERTFGWVALMAPQYLGIDQVTGKHMYSTNGGHPIEGVPRAWDLAAPYELVTGIPDDTGKYSVDTSSGIIRVGGMKPSDFRCEVQGDKTGGVWRRFIGEVVQFLAVEHGQIVTAADVAGIDAVPRTIGLHLPAGDSTSHRAAYDRLVGSVARGRWYIDLADRLVVTRLPRASTAAPVRTYRKASGATPGLLPLPSQRGIPAKQVTVRYAENTSPADQTAGVATAGDTALWSKQWREVASTVDDEIVAAWGTSTKAENVETALTLQADAEAELPEWVLEKSDPPQLYEMKVRDGAPGLWIGDAVEVVDDVAGFEAGGVVVVYGRTNRDRGGGATLYVEAQTGVDRAGTEDGSALVTEDGDYLMLG